MKTRAISFRKDIFLIENLVQHIVENLNVIDICRIARTSKTFHRACLESEDEDGLVLIVDDSCALGNTNTFVLLESYYQEMAHAMFSVENGKPFQSEMAPHIYSIHFILSGEEKLHQHFKIPQFERMYRCYAQILIATDETWEVDSMKPYFQVLQTCNKYALINCILRPQDQTIIDLPIAKYLSIFDCLGIFELPVIERIPNVCCLFISFDFVDLEDQLQVNLSTINSYKKLEALAFRLYGSEPSPTIEIPETLKNIKLLCFDNMSEVDAIVSDSVKERLQEIVSRCENLERVFLSDFPKLTIHAACKVSHIMQMEEFEDFLHDIY